MFVNTFILHLICILLIHLYSFLIKNNLLDPDVLCVFSTLKTIIITNESASGWHYFGIYFLIGHIISKLESNTFFNAKIKNYKFFIICYCLFRHSWVFKAYFTISTSFIFRCIIGVLYHNTHFGSHFLIN